MSHNKHREHEHQPQDRSKDVIGTAAADDVARRAYELFQERGREPGRELDDWLRAEGELKGSHSHSQSEE